MFINDLINMSMKAFEMLREIDSRGSEETIRYHIKNELHPYLSCLIKELMEKLKLPFNNIMLYSTEKDDYIIGANQPKIMKKHLVNPGTYEDGVDINVETFLEDEIESTGDVLNLLSQIMHKEIYCNIKLTGELSKSRK